jgi:hypothetical protein
MPLNEPYDDPMDGFSSSPIMLAPPGPRMPKASDEFEDFSYERDIQPMVGANRLFEEIGADRNMNWREKARMQQGLLQGVGDIAEQRAKIEQLRNRSEMDRIRVETGRLQLDDLRNRRRQQQDMQSRMSDVGKQIEGVLDLPIKERAQALAEIEARNFEVIATSPWAGRRIDSVRATLAPSASEAPPMFTGKALADAIAANVDNPAALEAIRNNDPIALGIATGTARVVGESAEERAKSARVERTRVIREFAGKQETFALDFAETDEMAARRMQQAQDGKVPEYVPRYMSPETHREAERAVLLLGTDEDKRAWEESNGSPDRDQIRVQITRMAVLRAENELLKGASEAPADVAESSVPL